MNTLLQRVERFIVDGEGRFEELAAAAARFGYEQVAPYRRLCDRRGVTPEALHDWRSAPAVPASAFKSLRLAAATPREVFRSSGTTRGAERRSVHHHPFPDLYRTVIDASFAAACLPAGRSRVPILSLIPDRATVPDSSLSFMAAHIFERHAAPGSAWAVSTEGIDLGLAREWLDAHHAHRAQRLPVRGPADRHSLPGGETAKPGESEPVLVLTTALALVLLLDHLEAEPARARASNRARAAATRSRSGPLRAAAGRAGSIRLPAGSRVFETGGFKGRSLETTPDAVRRRARSLLDLDRNAVIREYGMTELTSQAYSRPGGELLGTPPWMPFRVLDPDTLDEVEDGETGLLSFFDLANLGSVCHVLTEDLGVREGDAFRLLGRATGAELRGCSLTAEELGAA